MDKIKREFAYRTSDDKVFSGKNAAKKAKEHQKRVDFRNTVKEIIPAAEKIFGLKDLDDVSTGSDETELIDKLNNELSFECDDFDEWVRRFVDLYMEVPEIVEFFQFVEDKFKDFK